MSNWVGKVFYFACLCFLMSCAHSGDTPKAAKQEAPPPKAAVTPAPAPVTASVPTGTGTVPGGITGPSAEVPVTSYNFGSVHEGKDYVYDFKVRNAGTATLEIKKVLPG